MLSGRVRWREVGERSRCRREGAATVISLTATGNQERDEIIDLERESELERRESEEVRYKYIVHVRREWEGGKHGWKEEKERERQCK